MDNGHGLDNEGKETVMDKPQSDLAFKFMALGYRFRDLFRPRRDILKEVGIQPGFHVLDYGCGPGSYIAAAAELVGESGKIYAADIHPLAIQRVRKIASKKGFHNIETVQTDCDTGLAAGSVDVALLYDIFHALDKPKQVLKELHRVLKPEGVLSFSDHHMKATEILTKISGPGLFVFSTTNNKTYSFSKRIT